MRFIYFVKITKGKAEPKTPEDIVTEIIPYGTYKRAAHALRWDYLEKILNNLLMYEASKEDCRKSFIHEKKYDIHYKHRDQELFEKGELVTRQIN